MTWQSGDRYLYDTEGREFKLLLWESWNEVHDATCSWAPDRGRSKRFPSYGAVPLPAQVVQDLYTRIGGGGAQEPRVPHQAHTAHIRFCGHCMTYAE